MARLEFSKRIKLEAFQRSGGRCEKCTARLSTGNIEYHHSKEATFGGSNAGENCVVLCRSCHKSITNSRAAVIAKSNRIRARSINIGRNALRPFPCGRNSPFKKKMNGQVVPR